MTRVPRRPALALALLAALAGGCRAPAPPESTATESTIATEVEPVHLVLGPGDLVAVAVFRAPELSSPPTGLRVAPDGTLSVPLVGAVRVAGSSPDEAAALIEERLAPFLQEPAVTVSLVELDSRRFYVLGEVRRAGAYPLDRPLNAFQALAFGQGLTDAAKRDRIAILRPHGDTLEVHLFDAETPGAGGLVQIRPDDVLFVGRSGAGIFRDQVLPILQGIGFTTSQLTAAVLAADNL